MRRPLPLLFLLKIYPPVPVMQFCAVVWVSQVMQVMLPSCSLKTAVL